MSQNNFYAHIDGNRYRGGFDSPQVRDFHKTMSGNDGNHNNYKSLNISYSSSIDDHFGDSQKTPMYQKPEIHNNQWFYKSPMISAYNTGQNSDFGMDGLQRIQKGYGVNSSLGGQYGMRGASPRYELR